MKKTSMAVKLTLSVALLFCLGCERPRAKQAGVAGRPLRINLFPPPESLDPRIGGETRSLPVTRMLFEGLMRLEPDDQPALALAESIEVSSGGTVYTFRLRPSVWSNGDRVTAYDFEYAWKWVIAPESPSNFGLYFYPILNAKEAKQGLISLDEVGVKALDERTLVVTLVHPAPYFSQLVATPPYAPVHRQWEQAHPRWASSAEHFVCNGPFLLKAWEPGSGFAFEKNPLYWDADAVNLEYVQAYTIDDGYTAYLMYERGELDYIGDPLSAMPVECLSEMKTRGLLVTKPMDGVFRLDFNTDRFPFDNQKIRQALSYAIDRTELIENLLKGDELVATSLLPPNLSLKETPFIGAHEKASAPRLLEEGLKECGITREELPNLTLIYWAMSGHKALVQALQQQWQKTLGITIELEGCEFGVRRQRILTGNYDCTTTTWFSWYHDPIYNLDIYRRSSQFLNYANWEDPKFAALLDASDHDLEGRDEHLRAAEALIAAATPSAPIYALSFCYATHAEGIYLSPVGHVDFKWARVSQ